MQRIFPFNFPFFFFVLQFPFIWTMLTKKRKMKFSNASSSRTKKPTQKPIRNPKCGTDPPPPRFAPLGRVNDGVSGGIWGREREQHERRHDPDGEEEEYQRWRWERREYQRQHHHGRRQRRQN